MASPDEGAVSLERLHWWLLLAGVFLSTALPYSLQREVSVLPLAGGGINYADLLFAGAVGTWMLLLVQRRSLVGDSTIVPLMCFLAWLVVPAIIGAIQEDLFYWTRDLRAFAYYLYIPMFAHAAIDRNRARGLVVALLAGIAVSLGLFVSDSLGWTNWISTDSDALRLDEETRARVFFVDQYLTWIGLVTGLAWSLAERSRRFDLVLWCGAGVAAAAVVLVGGRADIVTAVAGVFAVLLGAVGVRKFGLLAAKWFVVLLFVGSIVTSMAWFLGKIELDVELPGYGASIARSIAELGGEDAQRRLDHYLASWEFAMRSPVFGNGLGVTLAGDVAAKYDLFAEVQSSGNAWMDLWERVGAVGLLLFVLFQATVLVRLLRLWPVIGEGRPVLAGLLVVWCGLIAYYTFGHPLVRWSTYGVTIGWLVGLVKYVSDEGRRVVVTQRRSWIVASRRDPMIRTASGGEMGAGAGRAR
jgi:hypothetical protein